MNFNKSNSVWIFWVNPDIDLEETYDASEIECNTIVASLQTNTHQITLEVRGEERFSWLRTGNWFEIFRDGKSLGYVEVEGYTTEQIFNLLLEMDKENEEEWR